ncbi:hypothetical protein QVD17_20656 [Tagetes erecta]|uniref:Alpha/beta hydrolase fold-3 domain-containing protein n=1 Tax=Tagetes erecta TaxID=13708 RepID=A0AAD8KT85_TARER|nr:hypothetical protein QVD17_20656 [Tagetes erecta]
MPDGEAVHDLDLPWYLLCVADDDLVIDTEMKFYEGMKKDGKKIELFVSNGVGHALYLNKIAIDVDPNTCNQTRKLIQKIASFVWSPDGMPHCRWDYPCSGNQVSLVPRMKSSRKASDQ